MAEKQLNLSFQGAGCSQLTSSTVGLGSSISQTLKKPAEKKDKTPKILQKPRGSKKPFGTSKKLEDRKLIQDVKEEEDQQEEKKEVKKQPSSKVSKKQEPVAQYEEEKKSESSKVHLTPLSDPFPSFDTWIDELGDWKAPLKKFITSKVMKDIHVYVKNQYESKTVIYPPRDLIFNAYRKTSWKDVKVVIVGQDPYIKPNQAMGLSFSIPRSQKTVPPSLKNIYSAIEQDPKNKFKRPSPLHGDLSSWAEQGVFMLNASLTVKEGKSNSHKGCGWLEFTKATMQAISKEKEGIIFMLWGKFAQDKGKGIDRQMHHVLEFQHPSPLAGTGFAKCKHFSEVNEILIASKREPINWNLN